MQASSLTPPRLRYLVFEHQWTPPPVNWHGGHLGNEAKTIDCLCQ